MTNEHFREILIMAIYACVFYVSAALAVAALSVVVF